MITTPSMGLKRWDQPNDVFSYVELSDNFNLLDLHDHTSSKGVQIPTGGLANLAVTNTKIANDAVDASKIATGAVGSTELASSIVDAIKLDTTLSAFLGVTQGVTIRRGAVSIPAVESTTSLSYSPTNLATPDRIQNVVVGTNGLLIIGYQAIWQCTVGNNAMAAIFIGANQLKNASAGGAPVAQEAFHSSGVADDNPLSTAPAGLVSAASAGNATEVTTGQTIGVSSSTGGVTFVFVAPGTYDVSVQFKNFGAATTTVKNRRLWVLSLGF